MFIVETLLLFCLSIYIPLKNRYNKTKHVLFRVSNLFYFIFRLQLKAQYGFFNIIQIAVYSLNCLFNRQNTGLLLNGIDISYYIYDTKIGFIVQYKKVE